MKLTSACLVVLSSLYITVFGNVALFNKLIDWYPESGSSLLAVASLGLFQFLLLIVIVSAVTCHGWFKWVLGLICLLTAVSSYFSDTFGIVIDRQMLLNALETNAAEASDLFTIKFFAYLLGLFVLPTIFLFKIKVFQQRIFRRLAAHLILCVSSLSGLALLVFTFSSFYVSFFREHYELRAYSSPIDAIYASYQFIKKDLMAHQSVFMSIGDDAEVPEDDIHRELMILVVGETARSDHFSLNGYERLTNPLLSKRDIVSFNSVRSCGTSTAISVPCMFSIDTKSEFDVSVASRKENALDVLTRAGVAVLWRDNNSSSKGVADRVTYENFRDPKLNPVCDLECRDVGMLSGLDQFIQSHPNEDILIVLHQMGSHGPAYHERVPKDRQHFQPTCQTNQLDQCTSVEIINSYDNTILYTDYFLDQVLSFLVQYDGAYETAFMYISDHGESLGEKGIYLHGLPYVIAPDAQTRVPMIVGFGRNNDDFDITQLSRTKDQAISHDVVFHTLLGIFEVDSDVYEFKKDLKWLDVMPDGG
jgi:lipid A ethanolaminephosphotransferase|tara:strand:- start:492 stop:2090 length:1599 start_codon:yes stop_codon:yes gene_type:complete